MTTAAPPKTYNLVSLYRSHMIILRPARDEYDAMGGRRTPDHGLMLKFEGYRCRVGEEEMALLAELPCFTGIGEPRSVWIEDDDAPMMPTASVQTVRGAVASRPQAPTPPVSGWDQMGIADIRRVLAEGKIDPLVAGAWERSHRNRKRVRQAIAHALLAEDGIVLDEEPVIPDTFDATGEEA
jgi:hypothetical protein